MGKGTLKNWAVRIKNKDNRDLTIKQRYFHIWRIYTLKYSCNKQNKSQSE